MSRPSNTSRIVILLGIIALIVTVVMLAIGPSEESIAKLKGETWDEEYLTVQTLITAMPSTIEWVDGMMIVDPDGIVDTVRVGLKFMIGDELFLDTARLKTSELAYIINELKDHTFPMAVIIKWKEKG